jgi:hypothetical protein
VCAGTQRSARECRSAAEFLLREPALMPPTMATPFLARPDAPAGAPTMCGCWRTVKDARALWESARRGPIRGFP